MILALLLAAAVPAPAATPAPALAGTWTVDLSPKADGSYVKPMVLTLNPDGSVAGEFYTSTIEAGRWKDQGGRVCVSFRTTDGKGPYHTAACLNGKVVLGQTWAEQRNFLFNWTATRP